jgi:hypothetical protein
MESTQRNDDDHGDPEDESQFEDDDSGLEDDTNEVCRLSAENSTF